MKTFIFEDRFIKNFNHLSGATIIEENKLYPKKIFDIVSKKVNDSSDETLNKIAIFGLFSNQLPFREFNDILRIQNSEQLDELYNKWYNNILKEILKHKPFVDDKDAAEKYLNSYVENIKSLGNNAKPFVLKDLEKSLIDVVNNNKWIKNDGNINTYNIDNPDGKDIIFEDNEIVILSANTRAKCVMYGEGESWCISQRQSNMFNTYRINHSATIYFVLQKNVKQPENKIVILNYGQSGYAIADQTNTGDSHGGPDLAQPWSSVEKELPNLRGKEKYFASKEITSEEKKYHEIISVKYNGDDIVDYIRKNTQNLVVNASQVTLSDFFNDYLIATGDGDITDEQFNDIWSKRNDQEVDDMLMKYLSTGMPINEYKFRIIEKG